METLLTSEGLFAAGTALVGTMVFCLASYLPSLFPPAFIRLVGFAVVCAALVPLYVLSESWMVPAIVGTICVASMAVAHFRQTAHQPQGDDDVERP